MKLTTQSLLEGMAEALDERIRPMIADPFTADAARMAASVVRIAARSCDDAAAIRVEENARIRALLAQGAALVDQPVLAASLAEAAAGKDPGYRISELDRENGMLRRNLIALHAWLEDSGSAVASELHAEIWRALRDCEMARAPRA